LFLLTSHKYIESQTISENCLETMFYEFLVAK